jgi:Glycosyl hydrolase family 12
MDMRKRNFALSLAATAALAAGGGVLTALPSGAAETGATVGTAASVPSDAVWKDSGQWATWKSGDYTLYNNIWGSGAGTQTIWARSATNWGVEANHPRTSGIKSYPNVDRVLNRSLSSLKTVSSSFTTTVPADGDFEAAYDIWANNNAYEVMVWTNAQGNVGPIAESYDANGAVPASRNQNIGGHTWNVYRGSNGANAVFSFVRTSDTNSGTIDLLAVLKWLKTNNWWGDVTIGQLQYGFEISGTAGTSDFVVDNYSLNVS